MAPCYRARVGGSSTGDGSGDGGRRTAACSGDHCTFVMLQREHVGTLEMLSQHENWLKRAHDLLGGASTGP